jgi:hypothetical protein
VRIECEKCHKEGYLQQLGNYYRVRHYDSEARSRKKYPFYYHQQSPQWVLTQKSKNTLKTEKTSLVSLQNNAKIATVQEAVQANEHYTTENRANLSLNLETGATIDRGCRLAWSRLVDLGSIDPGSNPGSPILFLLFCVWK